MNVSGIDIRRKMTKTEEESDDWFKLKQVLAKLVLRDIKEEWKVGNIPSTRRKIYEMSIIVIDIIEQSFGYLKERGEIYILCNNENNSDIILEIELLEKLWINFDQNERE